MVSRHVVKLEHHDDLYMKYKEAKVNTQKAFIATNIFFFPTAQEKKIFADIDAFCILTLVDVYFIASCN